MTASDTLTGGSGAHTHISVHGGAKLNSTAANRIDAPTAPTLTPTERAWLQGVLVHLPAACAFFRALRVYPSPVEFIMMVQSTLPAPIFKVCLTVTLSWTAF